MTSTSSNATTAAVDVSFASVFEGDTDLAGTGVVQDMLRDLERRDAGRANAPSPAAHFYAPSPSPGFGGDIIDGDVTHGDLDAFFQSA